jgi:putative redox protein
MLRASQEANVVDIDIEYQGELHCEARHRPSGATLSTDAPVDNHGRGESFSPTDLLATGLGTCMATVMGICAQKQGVQLGGMQVHVKKIMTTAPPRRVARLESMITIPGEVARWIDAAARATLEQVAHQCPVRLSLLEAIEVPIRFEWQTD